MPTNITWTEEQVSEFRRLFAEGYSYALIGEKLGYSRNACIGKANRLGLGREWKEQSPINIRTTKPKPRLKPILRIVPANGNSSQMRIIQTVMAEPERIRCAEVTPRNLTLAELEENDCRYIAGDDHLYCAHPKRPSSSYCEQHHALVWVSPQPPKERAFVKWGSAA